MTVGNVTTTTVRGLAPETLHAFWVRGLSENRSDPAGEQVDLYGRREPLPGVVVGSFGEVSNLVSTLAEDILFEGCATNMSPITNTRTNLFTITNIFVVALFPCCPSCFVTKPAAARWRHILLHVLTPRDTGTWLNPTQGAWPARQSEALDRT